VKSENIKIKKILLIQLRAIGDVILTTPVFTVLKMHYPQAQLHMLTQAGIHKLVEGIDNLNSVMVYPVRGWNIYRILTFYLKIRRQQYDLVVDYQCTPGTALITWLSHAPLRIGWKMSRRQWAYNLFSTANVENEYVAVQKCRALREIGIHEVSRALKIKIFEEEKKRIKQYFENSQIPENRFLVNITPLGKRPARQWIPEHIAALADELSEKYQAIVFFNRAPGEEAAVNKIAALCRHAVRVLPVWPLSTFSAFLSMIDLHISYDNGPKHMAMAVGTPTISLFATDFPVLWNPLHDPNHPYLVSDVPCRFCRLRQCPIMICMKQISVSDVIQKMLEIPALRGKLKPLLSSTD
jgi:ADP-heptose:LPS heptosyltransferase